jgi:hypothetical protein
MKKNFKKTYDRSDQFVLSMPIFLKDGKREAMVGVTVLRLQTFENKQSRNEETLTTFC